MTVFEEVKGLVPARAAAEMYGYSPSRSGFICCPFHGERTPSLKLYDGDRGFYCFGCGKGGSVVDFVGELFGLSPMEAVRRLNLDFNLGLPLDKPPDREQVAEAQRRRQAMKTRQAFEEWVDQTTNDLNACHRVGWLALKDRPPEKWTAGEAAAVRLLPALEDWADTLGGDNMEDLMPLFRDRERIREICCLILNDMQARLKTA